MCFTFNFSCENECGKGNKRGTKISGISIENYRKFSNQTTIIHNLYFERNDTLLIQTQTNTDFVNYFKPNGSDLMACSPNFPDSYTPDSINIFALSKFNSSFDINSNLNSKFKLLQNQSKDSGISYSFVFNPINKKYLKNEYILLRLALIEPSTEDSVKFKIDYLFSNQTFSTETKWIYFK